MGAKKLMSERKKNNTTKEKLKKRYKTSPVLIVGLNVEAFILYYRRKRQ